MPNVITVYRDVNNRLDNKMISVYRKLGLRFVGITKNTSGALEDIWEISSWKDYTSNPMVRAQTDLIYNTLMHTPIGKLIEIVLG